MTGFARRIPWIVAGLLLCQTSQSGQVTRIAIGTSVLQSGVKRLGINLGGVNYYDSGQIMKNLIFRNPGFEGEIYQSTIQCNASTPNTCLDANGYSSWPAGFWNGASFQFFYGAAQGRSGTITNYTAAASGVGGTFTLSNSGVSPAAGDYMIVRQTVPGNAAAGWWVSQSGAGSVGTNTIDLPPATIGKQTVSLSAPGAGDAAGIAAYFDSTTTSGISFNNLNGTFQLSFQAKGTGGSNSIAVSAVRYGGGQTFLNQTVALTGSWASYTLSFTAAETGTAPGAVGVKFLTVGADSFYLDNVSLVQTNSNPHNPTAFRDAVVEALQGLHPGVLRFWASQLGDTLDNLIADPFGRMRAGFSAWSAEQDDIQYSLYEFLQLCEFLGAEPWVVVPSTFSTTDAANLIDYLAGSATTVYGAKRAASGHPNPWTQSFAKIHLEFGNEAWNSAFGGGSIQSPAAYGSQAQTIFGAMRADASYVASRFDLVLGGWAANRLWSGRELKYCNNNDSLAIAPYMMNNIDSYATNEALFGSTFAEAEGFLQANAVTEGSAGGWVYLNQQAVEGSAHPVPLALYEMNLGVMGGSISQAALDGYASSIGGGLAVVDAMLQQMRAGILNQNLFALTQFQYGLADRRAVMLWGAVVDMGGATKRVRPQYLAMQLANRAVPNGARMLQTAHSGTDPTWNQSLLNRVQLKNAHDLESFAFQSGNQLSLIVFNLERSAALPVTFSGANGPQGTVQVQQLTSANITDTNENSSRVTITSSSLRFIPGMIMSLPPFSMTLLIWQTHATPEGPVSAKRQ